MGGDGGLEMGSGGNAASHSLTAGEEKEREGLCEGNSLED